MKSSELFKPNVEKLKAKKNINGLIKALNFKKDSHVRYEAANALGELGERRALDPLIVLLKEKGSIKIYAVEALGNIEDVKVVDPLIRAMKTN